MSGSRVEPYLARKNQGLLDAIGPTESPALTLLFLVFHLAFTVRREGLAVNDKRVEPLYGEEGLSLRRRRRRKRQSHLRVMRERPQAPNHAWAVDFVHDSLLDGRRFRALTVIDEWSRECLGALYGYKRYADYQELCGF